VLTFARPRWMMAAVLAGVLCLSTTLPSFAAPPRHLRAHPHAVCTGGSCLIANLQWSSNAQQFVAIPHASISLTLLAAAYPTVPSGTVSFSVDGVMFCSAALVTSKAAGTGTCSGSAPSVGTHSVSGTYSGDANFAVATTNFPLVVMNCVNAQASSSCATTLAPNSYLEHRGALLAPSPLAPQPYFAGASADPAWALTSPAHTATVAFTGQNASGASAIMGYDVSINADANAQPVVSCVASCSPVPLIQGLDPSVVGLPADSTNRAPSLRKINSTYYMAWAERSPSATQDEWCISMATSSYLAPGLLNDAFHQQSFELCASSLAYPSNSTVTGTRLLDPSLFTAGDGTTWLFFSAESSGGSQLFAQELAMAGNDVAAIGPAQPLSTGSDPVLSVANVLSAISTPTNNPDGVPLSFALGGGAIENPSMIMKPDTGTAFQYELVASMGDWHLSNLNGPAAHAVVEMPCSLTAGTWSCTVAYAQVLLGSALGLSFLSDAETSDPLSAFAIWNCWASPGSITNYARQPFVGSFANVTRAQHSPVLPGQNGHQGIGSGGSSGHR
jgi:hypothetical protein